MNRREKGASGEDRACVYLRRRGYRVLERNYRRSTGEIDIIVARWRTVAFVEVKMRTGAQYGAPAEAVHRGKQRHIVRTAQIYLKEHNLDGRRLSFDVIEVLPGEIRHIRQAFDAGVLND